MGRGSNRDPDFRIRTPIAQRPRKGGSKNRVSLQGTTGKTFFFTQIALFWGTGKWEFLALEPLFPPFWGILPRWCFQNVLRRARASRISLFTNPWSSIPWCFYLPWCFLTKEIPWCFECFQLLFSVFPEFLLLSRRVKNPGVFDGSPGCLPQHRMEDQGCFNSFFRHVRSPNALTPWRCLPLLERLAF